MKKIIAIFLAAVTLCSVIGVSAFSADDPRVLMHCGFDSAEEAAQYFVFGAFYPVKDGANGSDGGVMFGYSEAVVLQSFYDDGPGYFVDSPYSWMTYDTVARVAVGVDDMNTNPEAADNRAITLTYCNDNRYFAGRVDGREYVNFKLDFSHNQVWFESGKDIITEKVDYELDGTGMTWYEIGISVMRDRIRCFINGEMIFDIYDTKYLFAHNCPSPFLMWNFNNMLIVDDVLVTEAGDLFPLESAEETTEPETTEPEPPAPDDGPVLGDVNNDGVHNSNDAVLILRLAAKWSNVTDYPEAADVNQDGVVNAQDAVYMLRALAGWEKYPLPEIPPKA